MFEGFDTADVEHVEIDEYLVGPGGNAQLEAVVLAVYRTGCEEPEIYNYPFEAGAGLALETARQLVVALNKALSARRSSHSKPTGSAEPS